MRTCVGNYDVDSACYLPHRLDSGLVVLCVPSIYRNRVYVVTDFAQVVGFRNVSDTSKDDCIRAVCQRFDQSESYASIGAGDCRLRLRQAYYALVYSTK